MKKRHGRVHFLVGLVLLASLLTSCSGGGGNGTYSVSGTVVDEAGAGIDGIEILVTGSKSLTITTSNGGEFALTNLTGNCTISPSSVDYDFEPESVEVSRARGNIRFEGTAKLVETYLLTVELGTGGGKYAEGAIVTIKAGAPTEAGKSFDTWTSLGGGTFADTKAESTSFTMPRGAVTVTASYRDATMGDYFEFDGATGTITKYHKIGKYENLAERLDPAIPVSINGKSVIVIGEKAFQHAQITSVIIPESVTTIQAWAFNNNLLANVAIPESVTTIGEYAFCANKLTSIDIPDGIKQIPKGAFWLNKLTNVTIPTSVTQIGGSAFEVNSLEAIEIPVSVTKIGDSAFCDNSLQTLTIPVSVETVGRGAFDSNPNLHTLVIADDVEIGGYAFYTASPSVTTITIGSGVTLGENLLGEDDEFKDFYDDIGGGAGVYKKGASGWFKL